MRTGVLLAALALVGVAGGLGWVAFERNRSHAPEVAPTPAPVVSATPDVIVDPLAPGRPARLDASARPASSGSWVTAAA